MDMVRQASLALVQLLKHSSYMYEYLEHVIACNSGLACCRKLYSFLFYLFFIPLLLDILGYGNCLTA